ncbi:MAG: hypothetical protein LBN42_04610, partial [Oscillospiraceae bacterium]|nr:hypothetical protein [Oscillospiraceae bacterium]
MKTKNKKISAFISAILLCTAFAIPVSNGMDRRVIAVAETAVPDPNIAEENGISYDISGEFAVLKSFGAIYEEIVEIPETVEGKTVVEIAASSFALNSDAGLFVKHLIIPKTVTKIAALTFYYASVLETVEVDPDNPAYIAENGVLYTSGYQKLVWYPKYKSATEFAFPEGLQTI